MPFSGGRRGSVTSRGLGQLNGRLEAGEVMEEGMAEDVLLGTNKEKNMCQVSRGSHNGFYLR